MDMPNRLKSTLKGKISRIETFIESANEETDSVEIKVKLRTVIQLQKNVEEIRNNYYIIPYLKDAELTAIDEDLHLLEVRLESLEVRIETILNSSKKSSSGAVKKTNNNFEIKIKIPPLVLPELSGRYEEFNSFKIQFDDLITNNILLSESQKLYYLRSCLTHEVNYLCSNFDSLYEEHRLNAIAFCSDIKRAFLEISLADEHKDAVRFLWSDDEPCVHKRPKVQVYRFNRVNFGVSSSPFLLAATIRHHIEKYKHEFPHTVELLDRNFYVDDLISGGNEFEDSLQTSRRAKNIMEAAGIDLRKWITNDANLMEQWKKENFNVHPVHETVSLGANGTKVLGLSWNTNEDYLTTDTKSLLEFVSLDKNTKHFILQVVEKIFDPLGLISPFTGRMKCLLQDLWKEEIQWDDPLPSHIEKEWKKWCEELPHLRNLKIPRLVLDSTLLEDDVDRVAPLNRVTLPRLELLGALVAACLASKLITSLTDPHSWYHCAGKENPVDFLSRRLSADCLVSNSRWWTGAEFLSDSEFPKNFQQVVPELDYLTEHEKETVVQERKKLPEADRSEETVLLNNDSSSILDEILELSNNYFKVINILSYIFRFNYNCRNKFKKVGPLTVAEFKESEIKFIKHAQRSLFDKKEIPSSISNVFPFVDGERIARVGGRLENASLAHTRLFHVGSQGLLNAVRQKFWPLSGRSITRKTVHQCVTCFKSRPILSSQVMGNLPRERVNISSPFPIAGLDLCGPFLVKHKNQRKGTLNKVYICVCICFSTKAIHLKLLSDLTSDALIATLKRFTSRRDENLAKYFVSENIDWKFIPPKSPHFGGFWEVGVKSVKHHLKRAIGNLHFTFEEFETIMIQVEGILNSRPLTPLRSDADNFDPLTPGHFLIGRPITSIPEPNLIDVNKNRLSRWEKITEVVQRAWKKWKSDYLNTLQAKSKWITEKHDLIIGQMVLIKKDFLPINTWPLGRILEVYHWSDGKIFWLSQKLDFLPVSQINLNNLKIPQELADPNFGVPGKIDLLIGAEAFFDIIKEGIIRTSDNALVFRSSVFGYIATETTHSYKQNQYCGFISEMQNIDDNLQKFWEIETINEGQRPLSKEEEYCENHYQITHTRKEASR
ncbi:integrase catalytic domain-containing protein [Trichonephila clavipes]|nr:integrase catalytic domain-containing protein [Trichonephila clavipes]